MKSLKISKIPEYLKNGEYYKNLDLEDLEGQEKISIPKKNYKKTIDVENIQDFENLFHTCRFWVINYPSTFYDYGLNNKRETLKFLFSESDNYDKEINNLIEKLMESEKIEYLILNQGKYGDYDYSLIIKFSKNNILPLSFSIAPVQENYVDKKGKTKTKNSEQTRIRFSMEGNDINIKESVYLKFFEDIVLNKNSILDMKKVQKSNVRFVGSEYGYLEKTDSKLIISSELRLCPSLFSPEFHYNITDFNRDHMIETFKNIIEELTSVLSIKTYKKYGKNSLEYAKEYSEFIDNPSILKKYYEMLEEEKKWEEDNTEN